MFLCQDAPDKIMKYLIAQFAKVLPTNPEGRKSFVQNGCLQRILEVKTDDNPQIRENIAAICNLFPPQIVEYYSPGYAQRLLKQLEESSAPISGSSSTPPCASTVVHRP